MGFKPRKTKYRRSENSKQRGSGRLVIEVHPTGVKHFYFQYFRNSKRVLVSIGKYKSTPADQGISLGEAREISNNYGALLKNGKNVELYLQEKVESDEQRRRESIRALKECFMDNKYTARIGCR